MHGRIHIPDSLVHLLEILPETARPYLVGGCVRDGLLGLSVKDYDLEIFKIEYASLLRLLRNHGRTNTVGQSFGVIKWSPNKGETYDIALPRKEIKIGQGHRGFDVVPDPNLPEEIAAARRDFTINAMMYDLRRQVLLDPYQGQRDLEEKVLKHTSPAFTEDPLRVLRGMQFAGRFGLSAHPDTLALCREMTPRYDELPMERVWEEWKKWATRSRHPSLGLRFLASSGWLSHFPELSALQDTPQDPEWHPEGDVWEHTCHCCDALVAGPEWDAASKDEDRLVRMMAVLLHDIGKPATTERIVRDGTPRIVSPGHDQVGATLADALLRRLQAPNAIRERVIPLVAQHMIHLRTVTDRAVRRLAKRLEPETIPSLCAVMSADAMGRPPISRQIPRQIIDIQQRAASLEVLHEAPKPWIQGRDLLALGMRPGKDVGLVLHEAYEMQLDGAWNDRQAALNWLKHRIGSMQSPHSETT